MKIIAAAVAALTMLACPVQAQMRSREALPSYFYLFGEYDYYTDSGKFSYTDSGKFSGGGGGLGWKFNRYLGLQVGGQFLASDQPLGPNPSPLIALNTVNADATVLYGEVKLSWPLTDSLSIYASAGGAYSDAAESLTLLPLASRTANFSRSSTGYRIGVGAEYWFSRHWGLRASWHQHNARGVGSDLGAGIAFRF